MKKLVSIFFLIVVLFAAVNVSEAKTSKKAKAKTTKTTSNSIIGKFQLMGFQAQIKSNGSVIVKGENVMDGDWTKTNGIYLLDLGNGRGGSKELGIIVDKTYYKLVGSFMEDYEFWEYVQDVKNLYTAKELLASGIVSYNSSSRIVYLKIPNDNRTIPLNSIPAQNKTTVTWLK